MADMQDREMLVQLAELRQQMTSMSNAVDEIKSSVKEVITLDRTIAELAIHYQQQSREIQTQWAKIDANHSEIEAVDRRAEAWINKARGAWFTGMILGSLAQIIVLTMIAWTFNHLRAAEDSVLLMNARVVQIEQHKENKP
jgi:hypothetical protein